MLNKMGASISGAGESKITIEGVCKLGGVHHRVMPDRIEAGTYLCAAAACGGDVFLRHAKLQHLSALADKLKECGADRHNNEAKTASGGYCNRAVSRLSDRFASAVDGIELCGKGQGGDNRNGF